MGWTDFFKKEEKQSFPSEYVTIPPELQQKWNELQPISSMTAMQPQAAFGAVALCSFALGVRAGRMANPFQRYAAVKDIPSNLIGETAPFMRGRCVSVTDGDTIRVKHAPSIFHSGHRKEGEKLSTTTLPIRICTIDTPETAKFGNQGQPFGEEAKKRLSELLEGRIVRMKLLTTDQYGRAVAEVRMTGMFGWPTYYADVTMLKEGLAEVYTGSGAVYGNQGKDAYVALQTKAQSSRKGMWASGDRESAADYKVRLKAEKA